MQESEKSPAKRSRRTVLGLGAATAAGGLGLGALAFRPADEQVEFLTQKVSRASKPSKLKITDMRVAVLDGVPFTSPIVRIDTRPRRPARTSPPTPRTSSVWSTTPATSTSWP